MLQDRLVKAMRLRDISSIVQANRFLPEFIKDYNHHFAVKPRSEINLHRQLHHGHQKKKAIFSLHNTRKLGKNLMISKGMTMQLTGYGKGYRLRHKTVAASAVIGATVEKYGWDGGFYVMIGGALVACFLLFLTTIQEAKHKARIAEKNGGTY